MKTLFVLLVLLTACDPNIPDTTFEQGGAGSVAVDTQALTRQFTEPFNSNGGSNCQSQTPICALRLFVMQFTFKPKYSLEQLNEFACSDSTLKCEGNFGFTGWGLRNCQNFSATEWKCDLYNAGQTVSRGWVGAKRIPNSLSWNMNSFETAGSKAGQGSGAMEKHPKLVVVMP